MDGTSGKFVRRTFGIPSSNTSSQGSEGGPTPSDSQGGLKTGRSSPPPAPALPFRRLDQDRLALRAAAATLYRALSGLDISSASGVTIPGTPTAVTCGRKYGGSSETYALQSALASKLRRLTESCGSPEFELHWKRSATPLGPPICRLVASGRRTDDSDSSGSLRSWPTTTASDHYPNSPKDPTAPNAMVRLPATARMVLWTTPQAADAWVPPQTSMNTLTRGEGEKGSIRSTAGSLAKDVHLVGLPTPQAGDAKRASEQHRRGENNPTLLGAARLMGWATPIVNDVGGSQYAYGPEKEGGERKKQLKLPGMVRLVDPWPTPRGLHGTGPSCGTTRGKTVESIMTPGGEPPSSVPTETSVGSVLNPAFSRWLMAFPETWDHCSPGWKNWVLIQTLLDKS